jgi:hypothetical protein
MVLVLHGLGSLLFIMYPTDLHTLTTRYDRTLNQSWSYIRHIRSHDAVQP